MMIYALCGEKDKAFLAAAASYCLDIHKNIILDNCNGGSLPVPGARIMAKKIWKGY